MRSRPLLAALVALVLPMKGAACGQSACITVTASQLVNGACPDPSAAQMRFIDTSCGVANGAVQSVDGPGTLGDGLCCYPVTVASDNTVGLCGVGGGVAVATASTGFGGGTFSGPGAGGAFCTSTATCNQLLTGQVSFLAACGTTLMNIDALKTCGCANNCPTQCDPTLCMDNAPDDGCIACLEGPCASQLATCKAN